MFMCAFDVSLCFRGAFGSGVPQCRPLHEVSGEEHIVDLFKKRIYVICMCITYVFVSPGRSVGFA